jgi:hypothetical protein
MADGPRIVCVVDADRLQALTQTEADYRNLRAQIVALQEPVKRMATEYADPRPDCPRLHAGIMQLMALQGFYRKICNLTPSASKLDASDYAISELQNHAEGRKPGPAVANASWQRDNVNENLMKIFAAFALDARYDMDGGRRCRGQLKSSANSVVAEWTGAEDLEAYDLKNGHEPRENVDPADRLIGLRKAIVIKNRGYPPDSEEAMAVKTCREELSAAKAMPEPHKSNSLNNQYNCLLALADVDRPTSDDQIGVEN